MKGKWSVLPRSFAEVTLGSSHFRRALLAGSRSVEDQNWLGALEVGGNDGLWDVPENLRKMNAALRYSQGSAARGFSVTGIWSFWPLSYRCKPSASPQANRGP